MMDNFLYHFKRCLIAIFIILLLLFFPARRFLRENGLFVFGNKTLKEALIWAYKDSIRVADSLKRIKIKSNVLEDKQQDSLFKSDKEENPVFAGDTGDTYYIIAGSFANHENARMAAGKYRNLGYKARIISMTNRNGIKAELVSVKTFNNFNEADKYLKEFKSKFDPEAWIYSHK
ncbi:MAG: SPOR domain-containing protein [Bacteroidales bacterium]